MPLLGSMEVPAAGFSDRAPRMADETKLRLHWQYTHAKGRLLKPVTASPSLRDDIVGGMLDPLVVARRCSCVKNK